MTDAPTTTTGINSPPSDRTWATPAPSLLCDTRALTVLAAAPAGELWRLAAPGRELDAGITHLLPGQHVNTHTEEDPDVLLLILAGDATVPTADGPQHLAEGTLLWLPHGSAAGLTAGGNGLSCLRIHRSPAGTPTRTPTRTQQSTPRPLPGTSPASPDDTTQADWLKWLC
ncbi:hypothetical protein [Streptomyces sp. HUAS TT20]|uniref:hypothetical protein n=1 Tax=Streptomyces sp. HUAS TT20 TaxID=3447509 RepID=UPI0021D8B12E|nr:hypothetical protein [Streptomyces sp. HUAS 15-9]UXY31974.1 hypothetical protein N8I87_39125 [Streptomyces sp. HUAS 15-9]